MYEASSRATTATEGGRDATPVRKQPWVDEIVAKGKWIDWQKQGDYHIMLACALPVVVILVYLLSAVLRFAAVLLAPVSMLSPLFVLQQSNEIPKPIRAAAIVVYTGTVLLTNIGGMLSIAAYVLIEGLPQLLSTPLFLLSQIPSLACVFTCLSAIYIVKSLNQRDQ
ncbi:putative transmembrane protein [Gregarina niphandrodes]|uniref:Transmembrane protein n=1 Tax=Gregarina niphandrodes TaxID=110365 RepID=A0A023B2Q5_GRENI|nr:putative transmembrane protein [Gregarina niphandrodes]EZG55163.1 putative transmembrane protein [Gregarina niphandrodes]|eukprot:XP_011131751.1 putative transmembrane protein [Gregarina niphandrodes]